MELLVPFLPRDLYPLSVDDDPSKSVGVVEVDARLDPRPDGTEGVEALGPPPLPVGVLEIACRHRVDGVDKRTKEGQIIASLRKARGLRGLVGDVVNVARAWR